MMSANCSIVVTLSRVNRPCRTQCCSAKCLISTCFQATRSQTRCHASARRCVFLQTSSHGVSQLSSKFESPQELTSTNSCRIQLTFHHCSDAVEFLCSRPTSHARSSRHQQTTSSRPPFFVEVCPRTITPARQFRQLFSVSNQFKMQVSRALNVAQNTFHSSHVTLGRRGTRHCQRLCHIMQVETVSLEIHQGAHN